MKIRSKRLVPNSLLVAVFWVVMVMSTPDCILVVLWSVILLYTVVQVVLPEIRIIDMDEEGCTVTWLKWKKTHKWEELAIIREDTWISGRESFLGVVFSKEAIRKKAIRKKGKIYTTEEIFNSWDYLNCFYVLFDRISEEEFLRQMEEWGVKVEKSEKLKKEEQYKEMLEVRKKARERRKNSMQKNDKCNKKKH